MPVQTESIACGYGPEDEELRYMLFNPDLAGNKSWWSFFYSYKLNYLDGTAQSAEDEEILVQEWIDALKLKSGKEAAYEALFGSLTDSALQTNSFYKEIQQNSSAKAYFNLARLSESASGYYDPWDYSPETETEQSRIRREVIALAEKNLQAERNPFFQKKYAFQIIKAAYYENDENLFDRWYTAYFNTDKKSVLDWWATHYRAEILDRLEKFDSANYLHAQVFSHTSAKMFVSKQHFSKKNLATVLALAADSSQKADVVLLSEIINPGRSLAGITDVYRLNPKHKHLPLLISREINKLESWLGTAYVELPGFDGKRYSPELLLPGSGPASDAAYLQQFTIALQQMIELDQQQPEIFSLSLAYLALLGNNIPLAESSLKKVNTASYQKRVLDIILLTKKENLRDSKTQDVIGKQLQLLTQDRAQQFESQKVLFSLCSYLRYEFARNGMIALAGMLDNYANNKFCSSCAYGSLEYEQIEYFDNFASAKEVQQVIEVCQKKNKNSLETLLSKPYTNINYLYDLLAVKYLREGDLTNASEELNRIPDEFWYSFSNANQNLDRDPFLENSELLTTGSMNAYNKREVIEKMISLEQEAQRIPQKRAENFYQLGNAWYNFTDNSWFMIDYRWSSEDYSRMSNDRMPRKRALEWYKKALALEEKSEQKAKILYMIVLISQDENKREYAIAYEQLERTDFYKKRNCLTTADLSLN